MSWRLLRENLLPLIAFAGLVSGLVARFGFGATAVADGLWLAALLLAGTPVVVNTLRGLLRGQFAADVVAMLAIVTSVVMGEYLAGAVVVLMQTGGEALERYAFRRASEALDELLARAPRRAHRFEGDRLVEIDANEVRAGDRLAVKPGELVPADARVLDGQSNVDQSALTGEPMPVAVAAGSTLMSGSVNLDGALTVGVLRPAAESQYERIVQLVRQAQEQKPPIQRLADRAAVWFTPVTLVMCGLAWVVTGNPENILSVLVVATPCPLILAVPVAVISAINRAARHSIIVKNGAAIEQIGTAHAVVFDKTGTLTAGTPEVVAVVPAPGWHADDVLRLAAGVEQLSSHGLGRALAGYGAQRLGELPVPERFEEVVAHGVRGVIDGRRVQVGARRFFDDAHHVTFDNLIENEAAADGGMVVRVMVDDAAAGIIVLADRLRPGVPAMIAALPQFGIGRIVLLTGDGPLTAGRIAEEAGIAEVRSSLLPADKVAAVAALERDVGPTLMVGDGTNDAPALATATVGVAMGARGSGISAEAADVVLLNDDVTDLLTGIRIGRRMRQIALESVGIGLGLSFGLMVLAVSGLIPPPIGALLQEVVDFTVIVNALRARTGGGVPAGPGASAS